MKISVTDREGNKQILDADTNSTLMETIRDEGIDIEAACGGCCACATCHVYIDEKWMHNDVLEGLEDRDFSPNLNLRIGNQRGVNLHPQNFNF